VAFRLESPKRALRRDSESGDAQFRKTILGRGYALDVGQYRPEQSGASQLEEFVTEIG
jgi:hypothetical protein